MRQQEVADLAQLAEHVTSNDEVEGSNPLVSTIRTKKALVYLASFFIFMLIMIFIYFYRLISTCFFLTLKIVKNR